MTGREKLFLIMSGVVIVGVPTLCVMYLDGQSQNVVKLILCGLTVIVAVANLLQQ